MKNFFTEKKIELTITLGVGTYGDTVGDTVTLSNLRMYADMAASCGETMGACQLRVFGMSQSLMNQLTRIGLIGQAMLQNKVLVAAGDDESGMTSIFEGVIFEAWADYNVAPEAVFNIIAYVEMGLALKPVGATSAIGSASVANLMQTFATVAGLAFKNHGVNAVLANPYFPGTVWTQIKQCANAADINFGVSLGVLHIWPRGGSVQNGSALPEVSPETGLVGYPSLSRQGMTVKCLYNPGIIQGGNVLVKSSALLSSGATSNSMVAQGEFNVFKLQHNLSSQVPNGPWFTTFDCTPVGAI